LFRSRLFRRLKFAAGLRAPALSPLGLRDVHFGVRNAG